MISKNYESKIFQDPSLYQLSDTLGVKLSYEYDGVGVFSPKPNIDTEIQKLKEHIVKTGQTLFNITIQLTYEKV